MPYGAAGTVITGSPPACRVTNSAVQSITNGAWVALTFDTELFDTDTMHSTVSNTSRITATTAGLYLFCGGVSFATNTTGQRGAGFRKNGSGAGPTDGGIILPPQSATTAAYIPVSNLIKLAAGDYVELMGLQSSAGALNTAVSDGMPFFAAAWVGLGT